MMSLLAMSLGLRFCVSRKGGTGGACWVHPKGTNSKVVSGLVFRSHLTGYWESILFGINGVRKKAISPCRASISRIRGPFFSYGRLAFLKRLN